MSARIHRTTSAPALVLLLLPLARLEANPPPPPLAESAEVIVYKGESTAIPLRAAGRAAGEASFLIRSQPQHGALEEPVPHGPGRAVARYIHDDTTDAAEDTFTFAVQGPDSPVSAPGRIRIRIIERPPDFQFPASITMDNAFLGSESRIEFELENRGGGTVSGKMRIPSPWRLEREPDYQLGPGERTTYKLLFTPAASGAHAARIGFSHDPDIGIAVKASAAEPFTATPGNLELRHPDHDSDTATIRIENTTTADLELSIAADDGVVLEEAIGIPAQGSAELSVQADPAIPGGSSGVIRLTGAGHARTVAFRVFALPAEVRAEPAEGFDLGEPTERSMRQEVFRVINTGGSGVEITIEPGDDLHLLGPRHFLLPGGEEREIAFSMEPRRPGEFASAIRILHPGKPIELPVTAQVKPRPAPTPRDPSDPVGPSIPIEAEPHQPEPEATKKIQVPLLFEQLYVIAATPNSVRIAWRDRDTPLERFRVEERRIHAGPNGRAMIQWTPLRGVFMDREADVVEAEIVGLIPGSLRSIRIVQLDAQGAITAASGTFPIHAPSPPPSGVSAIFWAPIAIILLLAAWFFLRRVKKRDHATVPR